jgi:predicted DNA-binding ribbon-helix-helix protein
MRTLTKRSIVIADHKTSISLEDEFWDGLKEIAAARECTLSALVYEINTRRRRGNLSSSLRLFVLAEARSGRLPEKVHVSAKQVA